MFRLVVAVLLSANLASAAELTPRQRGDLAIQSRAILRKYCHDCHGKAERSFDALEYAQLIDKNRPVPFVNLADPARSQVIEFIEDGSMPPGGRPRPTDGELAILKQWVAANAPRYPRAFDDAGVLQTIAADWPLQPAPANIRYISLAQSIRDGQEFTSLAAEQARLQQALDAATTKERAFALQTVDDAATVFRVDIEKLGWAAPDLFHQIGSKGEDQGVFAMTPFDLILLENPYRMERDARFEKFLGQSKAMRPAPFLRGDWLADVLAPGAPLAADLKSLVELDAALKKGGEAPCGPKVRAFEAPKMPPRPGPPPLPLTAWYGIDTPDTFGLSFTWKNETSGAVRLGESFRFDLKAERDLRFRLLNVLADGSIRDVKLGGNVLKKGMLLKLGPTPTTFFKITSILSGADAATEYFVLLAAEDEMPVPTIVRSQHSDFPDCSKEGRGAVWRFFFDSDKFDGSRAVRRVLRLDVKGK